MQRLEKAFARVVVPQGTQQADAMTTVNDRARVLALTIDERCPPGHAKDKAIDHALAAMFWANHGISHRGD
jgi:hypothetical protein